MLLNKKILILVFVSLLSFSCNKNKSDADNSNAIDFENPEVVLQQAKNVLGNDVKFAYKGKFDQDTTIEIASGTETQSPKQWGIKFVLLKRDDNQLKVAYQTPLLNGSFKQCLVQKIKFPVFDYELIYYNSQDYFLGSGGGEVYSYLINYNEGKTYFAHLVTQSGGNVSLYLSENIDFPEVKNFFVSIFKRDYPSVQIVSKDIELKY